MAKSTASLKAAKLKAANGSAGGAETGVGVGMAGASSTGRCGSLFRASALSMRPMALCTCGTSGPVTAAGSAAGGVCRAGPGNRNPIALVSLALGCAIANECGYIEGCVDGYVEGCAAGSVEGGVEGMGVRAMRPLPRGAGCRGERETGDGGGGGG